MSKLYGVLILLVLIWGGYKLFLKWETVAREKDNPPVELTGDQLSGLGSALSQSYRTAAAGSTADFKKWLDQNGGSPELKDPRKAWIQLDYVVKVARDNPAEAKRAFAEVKARVDSSSKVYPRVQKLAATYD